MLGPARKATQVEIAMTEQFKLGIHPPIRESGDLEGTPGCTLEGPAGSVTLERGVICALRHIHMTPEDALRYGVRDKSTVRVRVPGDRELIFGDVRIRVDPNFQPRHAHRYRRGQRREPPDRRAGLPGRDSESGLRTRDPMVSGPVPRTFERTAHHSTTSSAAFLAGQRRFPAVGSIKGCATACG